MKKILFSTVILLCSIGATAQTNKKQNSTHAAITADSVKTGSGNKPAHNQTKEVKQPEKDYERDILQVGTCGARTQKGTPCKRRVKGGGRCWQHK